MTASVENDGVWEGKGHMTNTLRMENIRERMRALRDTWKSMDGLGKRGEQKRRREEG
jgi:hypothetical protein